MNSGMHSAGHLTAVGWVSLALYLAAACFSWRAATACRPPDSTAPSRIWYWLAAMLAVLGFNKIIDLQTLLMHAGHQMAQAVDLQQYRLAFHALFFLGLMLGFAALLAMLLLRRPVAALTFGRRLPLAACGCLLIFAYSALRAASIDHIDQMLRFNLDRIPFLWLVEAGGLVLIMADALRSLRRTA